MISTERVFIMVTDINKFIAHQTDLFGVKTSTHENCFYVTICITVKKIVKQYATFHVPFVSNCKKYFIFR